MARKTKSGVNKSEEIRQVLKANPKLSVKEVIEVLAKKNIEVQDNLVYFIKGKIKGRRGRRKKNQQMVAKAAATGSPDPVKAVLQVRALASDLGGLKKLKMLVDALSE